MIIMAKKRYFAWSPIRALMADNGAKIVSRDAVAFLITVLQDKAISLTERAKTLAKHSKRKKVTAEDVKLAIAGI
ncbi:MAG: histone [Candidatus Lokiarchaeota archaeon]|nr:histone [Candidatus Lokiarchaeota archaeon]